MLRKKLFHAKSQQINRGNKFITEVWGETATLPGSRLRGPAVQCSADRRGHTEGGRAAPEKVSPFQPERAGGLGSIDRNRRDSERPPAATHP